jgi:hypothetical protein
MFKFLRKYNKWILAVGGTLLLIVFLIPQAIQGLSERAGATSAAWATMGPDNREVRGGAYEQAQRELRLLEQLGVNIPGVGKFDAPAPAHWFLLTHEASQAGFVGGGSSVNLGGQTEEALRNIALQTRTTRDFILDVLNKLVGVQRLVALHQDVGTISDRRLMRFAERRLHDVTAQMVVIEASGEADGPDPTEEEILAHMAKYADVKPGEGEFGFGYRLPNRVKLEWLTIDRSQVESAIRESGQLSGIALRKHWHQNPATLPAYDEKAATVPEAVRDSLLTKLADEKLEAAAKTAWDEIRRNHRTLAEKDGFYDLPADWSERMFSLESLASHLQREVQIPLPAYRAGGETWYTQKDLEELDGLGRASTDKFGASSPLPALVMAAREFEAKATTPVQKGIALPPLRDADGNLYIVRIIDTDSARPPRDLSEVREAIVRDLRRHARYRELLAEQGGIEQAARTEGLLAVALAHDTIVQPATQIGLTNPAFLGFMRQAKQVFDAGPSSLPQIGPDKDVVGAIVDRALALPRTAALDSLPEDQRTFIIPADKKMSLLIVRLTAAQPVTVDSFREDMAIGLVQTMYIVEETRKSDAETADGASDGAADGPGESDEPKEDGPFSLKALAARHNFKFIGGQSSPVTEDMAAGAATGRESG